MHPLLRFLRFLCIEIICWFLYTVRQFLGPVRCRYPIGCTSFALHKLRSMAFHKALWIILRRLCSCTSWYPLHEDLFE